jgi:hypothetical protein
VRLREMNGRIGDGEQGERDRGSKSREGSTAAEQHAPRGARGTRRAHSALSCSSLGCSVGLLFLFYLVISV